MKSLLVLVPLLALSACDVLPNLLGTAASTAASAANASSSGSASANPAPPVTGVTPATPSTTTTTATAGASSTTNPTPAPSSSATKTITFDTARKLEYADVWVDMGDPTGQRALVPYLMKPKDWMLIGCEMTSTTSKHYRFMKVSSNTGTELPDVDIFKQGR